MALKTLDSGLDLSWNIQCFGIRAVNVANKQTERKTNSYIVIIHSKGEFAGLESKFLCKYILCFTLLNAYSL